MSGNLEIGLESDTQVGIDNISFIIKTTFFDVGAVSLASQGRRLSFPPTDRLEGQGDRTLGGGGVEDGLSHPLFVTSPSLSDSDPYSIPSYSPTSIKGKTLHGEVLSLIDKGAVEPAPPFPGYYSRLLIV